MTRKYPPPCAFDQSSRMYIYQKKATDEGLR